MLCTLSAPIVTSFTAAILNLIGIMILNILYRKVAVKLNDWENHQKETEYTLHGDESSHRS